MMFVHTKRQFASRDPFPTKIANFMYFPLYDTPLSKSFFLLGCSSSNFWSSCSSMCFWAFSTFYRTCTHASSCGRRATQRGPSSRRSGCWCPFLSASWTSSPGEWHAIAYTTNCFLCRIIEKWWRNEPQDYNTCKEFAWGFYCEAACHLPMVIVFK